MTISEKIKLHYLDTKEKATKWFDDLTPIEQMTAVALAIITVNQILVQGIYAYHALSNQER